MHILGLTIKLAETLNTSPILYNADNQRVDSIYDVPIASGMQEQKGALPVTDLKNTVNAPMTDGTWTSAGNAIPDFVVPTRPSQ